MKSLSCISTLGKPTSLAFSVSPPRLLRCAYVCGCPLQEVDLRDLFSFDKLRESGRVSVITTEEFIEKEALSGNLGILPSEDVLRLNVRVRRPDMGGSKPLKPGVNIVPFVSLFESSMRFTPVERCLSAPARCAADPVHTFLDML